MDPTNLHPQAYLLQPLACQCRQMIYMGLSAVMESLGPFIPPPAPFSSIQQQQLTQPPPSLPKNFGDITSDSSSNNTGSVSNDMGARQPRNTKN